MSRQPMQKQKLLYLMKIMLQKTDENHPLTTNQIIAELERYGIQSERKSIYSDLNVLETFGLDICRIKSNNTYYYVGSREFEVPELRLLVDAIQSSKFITHKKSLALIKKLEGLASEHEGKLLQHQVVVANRVKTINEKIYYNVDTISNAISNEKQIVFKYFSWVVDFGGTQKIVKQLRKNGDDYKVSPWALCWDDENYYMIAYDNESHRVKHYRVDKMESISITDDERDGKDVFDTFDIGGYAKSVFSMFGGTENRVKLSVNNELIGVIIDRFGSDVYIYKKDDNSFYVDVKVMLSPQFYGWLFGFGNKMQIVEPQSVVEEFKNRVAEVYEQYGSSE